VIELLKKVFPIPDTKLAHGVVYSLKTDDWDKKTLIEFASKQVMLHLDLQWIALYLTIANAFWGALTIFLLYTR